MTCICTCHMHGHQQHINLVNALNSPLLLISLTLHIYQMNMTVCGARVGFRSRIISWLLVMFIVGIRSYGSFIIELGPDLNSGSIQS
jgi:hypothetical protein